MLRSIFCLILLGFQVFTFSQVKDVELVEERTDTAIKLYAVNNTDGIIEVTFTADIQGFITQEKSPIVKQLQGKAKEYLMTLTAPPGVDCGYSSSVSYKKMKSVAPSVASDVADTKKIKRTTAIQMNSNKINVFTQDGCGRCEFVIGYLDKNNIPYTELNTTIHEPNQTLMFDKLKDAGFTGNSIQMPVVVYQGKTNFDIKDLPNFVKGLK